MKPGTGILRVMAQANARIGSQGDSWSAELRPIPDTAADF